MATKRSSFTLIPFLRFVGWQFMGLAVPTIFFLGAITAMQFIQR